MEIPKVIKKMVSVIQQAGGKSFLVGGAVVDAIQGRTPKDWDLEIHGLNHADLFNCLGEFDPVTVGKSFGVIKLRAGGLDVDVSIPRRDNNADLDSLEFVADMSPEEAGRRRDFTINSMFFDLETHKVIDPFNGMADLQAGILRATDPETFVEDPLRALRAMQLLPRKAKVVDPATVELIRGMVGEFDALPGERVFVEFEKLLLKAEKPSIGLEFLKTCGWLRHFPELEQFTAWSGWEEAENRQFKDSAPHFETDGCPQNPDWHPEGDVWIHNNMVLDAAAQVRHMVPEDWRLAFMFAALLHDVAKPITTVLPVCTARGHEPAGGPLACQFLDRMTNQKKLITRVEALVMNHLQPFQLAGKAKPAAWRRLHRKVGRLDVLGWLSRADWAGRGGRDPLTPSENGKKVAHSASFECFRFFDELGTDDITPTLQGRDLIAAGHKPGRNFGAALNAALEAQIDDPTLARSSLLRVAVGCL